jgi:hypothetical protein
MISFIIWICGILLWMKMSSFLYKAFLLIQIAAGGFGVTPAQAALGGGSDSVEADRRAMHAPTNTPQSQRLAIEAAAAPSSSSTSNASAAYSVSTLESGTITVREFLTPQGTVFGVAWNGLTTPDLSQLLGSHYDEYQAEAAKSRSPGHRNSHAVRTEKLVVEASGHMRDQRGRAYLPGEVPSGVSLDDIK